jgi:hypothetical protein
MAKSLRNSEVGRIRNRNLAPADALAAIPAAQQGANASADLPRVQAFAGIDAFLGVLGTGRGASFCSAISIAPRRGATLLVPDRSQPTRPVTPRR